MSILLIDIGSTNIKWAVTDFGEKVPNDLHSVPFPPPLNNTYPYYEVSIDQIISIIKGIIDDCLPNSLFISTQMHGYVLADKSGKPITQYISWQDERATLVPFLDKINKEHGVDIKPNLPRASVYAISKLNPKLFMQAYQFFTLGSYVNYVLTGNNITHITDAAPSGFYNVKTLKSDYNQLELPIAKKDVEKAGEYKGIAVYTPVGDQQAAILGVNATNDSYILNLGTAGQLCTINGTFITGDFESRPYFWGKTLCTVTRLMGGKAILEYQEEDLEEVLFNNYYNAMKKLPQRKKLIITGGVVKYRREMLTRIAQKIGIEFSLNEELDAINGLKILMEEHK